MSRKVFCEKDGIVITYTDNGISQSWRTGECLMPITQKYNFIIDYIRNFQNWPTVIKVL